MVFYGVIITAYLTAKSWLGCLLAIVVLLLPLPIRRSVLLYGRYPIACVLSSGTVGLALRNSNPSS